MNTRGQYREINEFKLQTAKSIAEAIAYCSNRFFQRQAIHKILQYINSEDATTFLQIQDPLDETNNFENQKNHSFMNESKSERNFSRLGNQASLIPQRSTRKIDKDLLDSDKNLTAGLNRSLTKPGTFVPKEQEGPNEKALELNASESKWPAQNNYEEDKKFKLDLFSVPTKNYTSSTLRVGDIVYFKHIAEIVTRKDGKPTKMVAILSGDGISSNRLECVNRSIQFPKNANFSFKKCLFRVETSRKYYYQKLYKEMKRPEGAVDGTHLAEYESKLNFIKKKYNEEIEENNSEFKNVQGQPVLYGQTIHLKHLYSECYLTLQPHSLAWQYGCVQLTLEEEGSEDSNFKFMTSGNLKTKEDVVAFSDPIHIASSRGDYFMHVWDEVSIKNTPEAGLEVNGSESASNWKLLRFMDCDEYQEYEENNTYLESGDIVRIIHKKTGSTLSVPPKTLEPMISVRNIILNNELEENYGPQRTNIPTKFIDSKIPTPEVLVIEPQKYTVCDLWEVQRRNAFIGGFARWDETFRLKNVSTGLFLSQDPISERLKLTPDGMREECYFVILPKKTEDKRHRIEYGDLLRIQTFNRSYLQQPIGKDPGDVCGPKVPDTTKLLFYLEFNPSDLADTAFRLSSLFPSLLNFHCFLQNWGIHIQSGMLQKDDIPFYDYSKALESEKDLDFEADCLGECLENLEDFLKNYQDLPFKIKQKLLIEQRIIEILLLIIELINTKIYGISSAITDENDEEGKMAKIPDAAKTEEEWDLLEKTPQYLARKYLDKHVRRIYKILLLSTKHSIALANVILKNSIFLSRQLTYYRKEAGDLLKEAIKHSAQLGDTDPHGEQIVKWVGLLEMIRQNDGNVPLQILYLETISLACLDIEKRGIAKYQNKVLQEFFSPNSHFLKGLITFAKKNGKIYVSFARKSDVSKEEFLDYNDSLSPSNEVSHEDFEGKFYFSLQELSVTKSPGVDQIIDYLSAVLWLFYSLCKDRNQDGINHIKGIGLQADVLMHCMLDDYIHIKLKRGFIVLYEVLFIDVEPYRTIKDCSNYCYVWEEIERKNLSEHTYLWHSLSNSNRMERMKDYDREKVKVINEFISEFWIHGKNIVKFSLFGASDKFANSDAEYLEKAGLIHAMLKFTKNAVNLGFTNSALNNQILYSIINLFAAFKKAKDKEKGKDRKDNYKEEYWVSAFMKSNGLSTRSEIFDQIYLEALEIFQVMADLRLNLQIAGFLKVFKISFEHGVELDKDAFNRVFSVFLQKYGLNISIPEPQTDKSVSDQEIELLEIWRPNHEINSLFNDIVKEVSDPETQNTIQSGLIFINMLFEVAGKNKYLEKQTRKVLRSFFDQRDTLLADLKKIEIISGKREIEIFTEFDAAEGLEIQIAQVLQDDENLRQNYKIDHIEYRTRIIDINNSLNRMIARFKQRKGDYKLTLKTQNIMRNLNIYSSVLKVFKLSYREADHKEVFKSAISVLYHFCKNNVDNQEQLYPYVPELLDLIQKRLQPAKLICQIFSNKKTTPACHQFIDTVFDLLNEQDSNFTQTHPQYLIILRSLILDDRRNAINENQRMIMSRLMKNKGFLSIIDWKVPDKPRLNTEVRDEDMAMLNYQVENMLLLGNLALDTRLGIIQAKKTLSYDQIKAVLVGNSTPFLQKKAFLRCLFQIYITKCADLNKDYDKKSMVDILNSVVMPDLKIFEKYIEGVIEIPPENNEKQKKAYDLRDRVKKYRQKLSTFEGRDDKILGGAVPSGKKLLPPINSHNDQKKILRDASEYWEYLNSGKSWNMKQDGLLYFIIDCFYEIEQRGGEWMDENLKETLSNIRASLTKMNEMLLKIEEEINRDESTMRLTKFTVLINECIDRLPDKKVVRLGKGVHIQSDGRTYQLLQDNTKYDHDAKLLEQQQKEGAEESSNDPVMVVLKKIKSFIMKRKMTLEDFMGLFRSVEDKMDVDDFRSKLKTFLGNLVKLEEIDNFIDSIQRSKKDTNELDNKISLSKVYRKLQKSFERDRAVNFKEMMKKEEQGLMLEDLSSPDSLNISRALKKHINFYTEFNLNNEEINNELRDIMTALFSSSKKKMTKKKMEEYKITLDNLIKIFKKKHYGIYMLKMLKYLLKYLEKAVGSKQRNDTSESDSDEDEEEALQSSKEMDEFKQIQLIFAKSDALIHCLNNIREGVPKKLVSEAVEVLNLMLKDGNRGVQAHILETLKQGSLTSGFFNYIKLQFWSTLANFKKIKQKEEVIQQESTSPAARLHAHHHHTFVSQDVLVDLRITENLIKLIQLFCENCFNEFQNFLRSQKTATKTSVVSSNLVNELSNFLIDLQLTDPNIFQNTRMLPLVDASLATLIDFCMGPCQENQELLGNQRHLISFINSFVNKDINFNSSNENDLQMIDIFSTITKFLLALVNGNKNKDVKEFLLNQLNTDALIRKLVVIYTTKISNRDISIFRQDRRCPRGRNGEHSNGCAENHCVLNFLTPKDLIITETAFNIYILLTIFTDEFEDNLKLEKFRYDKLNSEEKEQLEKLEAKYKADKKRKGNLNMTHNALLQLSSAQMKKKQIFPADSRHSQMLKLPTGYKGLLAQDNEESAVSPGEEASSEALISPLTPVTGKKSNGASALSPSDQNPGRASKIDFVKKLAVKIEQNPTFLDKDVEKMQEEEAYKEFFSLKERSIMYRARKFFKTFINSVEVIREEQISKNYFQVPFECDYMTDNIREHMIFKANRNSDDERLEHFFFSIPLYHAELLHRQKISRNKYFEWFVCHWKLFKDIAYLSVLANNILFIVAYKVNSNDEIELSGSSAHASESINLIFSIIQISLSILVVIFGIYERLPISLYKKPNQTTESSKKKVILKKNQAIEKNRASLFAIVIKFTSGKLHRATGESSGSSNAPRSYHRSILKILLDPDNLYNICYLIISIIAFATTPLVYSILLLDIVKRSDDLQNIIKSITHNITQLIKAMLLGLIVMYFYGIIAFSVFRKDFQSENVDCSTLLHCWTSIVNYGVTGGNMGDVMANRGINDHGYWGRWVYDITFFVLVIVILLNIIFGIIIDTFGDLRDRRNEELKQVEETCFICGLDKYDFDTRGNGWYEHIYKEHNIYAYLNFCIYIEKKDMTECNGVEKYVKEMILNKKIEFIPQSQAIALIGKDLSD